jgi:hypothetical protein
MFETYMKIGSNYYGTNDTIFVIEQPQLSIDMGQLNNFWNDKPVISEIPETDYTNRIEKDIAEEYETFT